MARYCVADNDGCVGFWQAARHPQVVRTAWRTALVIGTVLTLINQGDVYLEGHITWLLAAKTVLTYCVPYGVATYGALSVAKVQDEGGGSDGRG